MTVAEAVLEKFDAVLAIPAFFCLALTSITVKSVLPNFPHSLLADRQSRVFDSFAMANGRTRPYNRAVNRTKIKHILLIAMLCYGQIVASVHVVGHFQLDDCHCLLYTSPSPRDRTRSRMPSSA